MKVAKEIRYDPEKIPSNLRYIDRKKVSYCEDQQDCISHKN